MARVKRLLPLLLAVLVVAAAALAANLVVLDRAGASRDDIGNLSPVQPAMMPAPATSPVPQPPSTKTAGDDAHHDGEHRDDDD
jgi:hypothetical protein